MTHAHDEDENELGASAIPAPGVEGLVERLTPSFNADLPFQRALDALREEDRWNTATALNEAIVANNALKREAATALARLQRERDEAQGALNEMAEELQAICDEHGCLGGERRTAFIAKTLNDYRARSTALEAALRPLAKLIVPKLPRSSTEPNFGVYSIFYSDIEAARTALSQASDKTGDAT